MIIRAEQMQQFEAAVDEAFAKRVASHLREKHADSVDKLDAPTLLDLVTNGIQRGRGHGLRGESSLTKFVALMFVIGPDFDHHLKAASVLADTEIAPDDRVDALVEALTDEDWREARANSRPSAWLEG